MATAWGAVHTKCPFYISENGFQITCESIIGSKATIQVFSKKAEKNICKENYCNDIEKCKSCPHYQSLMKLKYDD